MSIIADALNRLQSVRAGSSGGISPPATTEAGPPRHSQPVSRRRLVLIILAGIVGIGASVYGFGVLTVHDVPAKEIIVAASHESADPPQPVVVAAIEPNPISEIDVSEQLNGGETLMPEANVVEQDLDPDVGSQSDETTDHIADEITPATVLDDSSTTSLVKNIRVGHSPKYVRVVFDLERQAVYEHQRVMSSNHATIMIQDVVLGKDAQQAIVNADIPVPMRIYPWKGDWVRIDLDLDMMRRFRILDLDDPIRLVVDLYDVSERQAPGTSTAQALPEADAPSAPSPEDALPLELVAMPPADTLEPESDPKSRYVTARTFLNDHMYEKTIEALSPLFHSPPNEWQPWYLMAIAALGLGDLDDSEHYVIEGLTRNGSIPQLWVQRALIAQQRENHDLALHALGQAARLEPDLPEIHLNMAYSFEAQGKIDRATEHYRKFLALTEHNAAYHMVRKKVLTRVMQFKT